MLSFSLPLKLYLYNPDFREKLGLIFNGLADKDFGIFCSSDVNIGVFGEFGKVKKIKRRVLLQSVINLNILAILIIL